MVWNDPKDLFFSKTCSLFKQLELICCRALLHKIEPHSMCSFISSTGLNHLTSNQDVTLVKVVG
jgi:hypothetical protein